MIYPELNKLIADFNTLIPCSVDDICDGLVGANDAEFVRKSDVLDILNRYVKAVYERERLSLQIDLTQANLDAILEKQNWHITRDWRMAFCNEP